MWPHTIKMQLAGGITPNFEAKMMYFMTQP